MASTIADTQTRSQTSRQRGRRELQDHTFFNNHGPLDSWQKLTEAGISLPAKTKLVAELAVLIGLRCPNETTLKQLTAVSLCKGVRVEDLPSMDEKSMFQIAIGLKHAVKTLGRASVYQFAHLTASPPKPADMGDLAYNAAYKDAAPILVDIPELFSVQA